MIGVSRAFVDQIRSGFLGGLHSRQRDERAVCGDAELSGRVEVAEDRELQVLLRGIERVLRTSELIDRFGPLPKEVNTLLLVMRIKSMCKRAGISRIDAGPKGATVQFHNDKFANPAGLVDFIKADPQAKVQGNKIVLLRDWKTEGDRIKGAFAIAKDLAEKVVRPKA